MPARIKKTNKLFKVLESKKFKNKLGPNIFFTRVSSIIHKARSEKRVSQQKLSKMVGTTQRIISEIENGSYNMGGDLLYRLFKNLNKQLICDGKNLITGEEYVFNLKLKTNVSKISSQKSQAILTKSSKPNITIVLTKSSESKTTNVNYF
jgi:transcriptional regulator with XRE-family HTH domain